MYVYISKIDLLSKKCFVNKFYLMINIVLMNIYIYKRIYFGNLKMFFNRYILFGYKWIKIICRWNYFCYKNIIYSFLLVDMFLICGKLLLKFIMLVCIVFLFLEIIFNL